MRSDYVIRKLAGITWTGIVDNRPEWAEMNNQYVKVQGMIMILHEAYLKNIHLQIILPRIVTSTKYILSSSELFFQVVT